MYLSCTFASCVCIIFLLFHLESGNSFSYFCFAKTDKEPWFTTCVSKGAVEVLNLHSTRIRNEMNEVSRRHEELKVFKDTLDWKTIHVFQDRLVDQNLRDIFSPLPLKLLFVFRFKDYTYGLNVCNSVCLVYCLSLGLSLMLKSLWHNISTQSVSFDHKCFQLLSLPLFSIFFARRGSIHFDFRSSFLLWSSLWFSLLFPFPASFSSRFAHCFHWLPLNYLSEKEWEEENNIRQNTQSIEHNDDDSDDDKRKSKRHESAFTGKKREDAIPLTVYSLFFCTYLFSLCFPKMSQ